MITATIVFAVFWLVAIGFAVKELRCLWRGQKRTNEDKKNQTPK